MLYWLFNTTIPHIMKHYLVTYLHYLIWLSFLAEGECFEIDTDYNGTDIKNIDGENYVIADSANECQLSCQALSNCKVWTYCTGGSFAKRCFRKSMKYGIITSKPDRISGQQFCGLRNFGFAGLTLDNSEKVIYIHNSHVNFSK